MPEETPDPALQPLGSGYLLETPIGSGATGQVWRARTRDGRPVAIKVLRPELGGDPAVVARFLQEAQILQRLSDPHLVAVRDLVAEGSRLAVVMDLVDGPDLRVELARRGTVRPIEAAEIVDGVLAGLAALHAAGIAHGDVKPENVLLAGGAPGGAMLTDLGVARIIDESQKARRTTVIGTPEYLAPEVADGGAATPASDLYAVGVVLYELVAGVTPFAGGSPLAVLRRHADQQPVRPEGMPDGIWSTVSALLAKDPAQRPQDAGQVREGLRSAAASFAAVPARRPLTEPPSAPVVAQPTVAGLRTETQQLPTVVEPVRPASRRRQGLLIAAAAVILLLLAGGGVAFALTRGGTPARAAAAPVASSSASSSAPAEDTASSSASATATTSTSASPSAGTVPAVTGMSLSQAQTALTNAGLQVTVKEVLSDQTADNTVTAQDPLAGASAAPGSPVTLTVARRTVGTFLSTEQPVEYHQSYNVGTATLNGKTYVHGITSDTGCQTAATLDYDLGRHYKRFTMAAGLSDDSSAKGALQIDVVLDGRTVFSQVAKLGQPVSVDVDVTGGLRLEFSATRVEGSCSYSNNVHAVWGDPEVFGTPDEVPAATASPTN